MQQIHARGGRVSGQERSSHLRAYISPPTTTIYAPRVNASFTFPQVSPSRLSDLVEVRPGAPRRALQALHAAARRRPDRGGRDPSAGTHQLLRVSSRPGLRRLRVRLRGPVRTIGGISGAASRVAPAVTLKSEEARLIPVGGSAARPSGRSAPVPPHAEFVHSYIGASVLWLSYSEPRDLNSTGSFWRRPRGGAARSQTLHS